MSQYNLYCFFYVLNTYN